MIATGWIDQVRDLPVGVVGELLGLELRSGPSLAPCPACAAPCRSMSNPSERRGPVGLTNNGLGWRCHRCDAHGDAIELVRHVVGAAGMRAWFEQHAYIQADQGSPGRRKRRVLRIGMGRDRAAQGLTAPQQPILRPPADEIAGLWARCRPVTDDAGVVAWMQSRGWSAVTIACIASRDLARVLPAGDLPAWACWARPGGGPWSASGHRVLLPLWGSQGDLVSLRARYCELVPTDAPKSLTPYRRRPQGEPPYGTRGLVLADDAGQALLRTESTIGAALWICEGEPDFLRLATWWGDAADDAPAVWGIGSGTQTPDLIARIQAGTRVVVATHPDKAGDKYAGALRDALAGRCTVERFTGGDDARSG